MRGADNGVIETPGAAAPAPVREGDGDLDVRALVAAIWRRRGWIIVPTLAALLISAAAVQLVTPRYKSEARLLIENRENAFLRPEVERRSLVVDRAAVDQEAVNSQVQVLMSRDLARQVVRSQDLADRAEFRPRGLLSLGGLLRLAGLSDGASDEERVLRAYFQRLRVYQIDRSRVIVVEFESADAELAARVANEVVDAYLGLQQLAKRDSTRQASTWLQSEIEVLRRRVAEAETRAQEFRARANLFVGANNTLLDTQQLGELSTQLALARAQKAEAEAKARAARGMLTGGPGGEALDVVNSELMRRLTEQQVTLRAQLAQLSATLLDGHPNVKQLRAQIARLGNDIRDEAMRLVRAYENEARIAGSRVDTLMASIEQVKSQAAGSGEQDVQLRALEREAKAQRDLLESYLASYRESSARDTLAAPADARIVSRAAPASEPSFPKKIPTVLVATLGTFVLAFGFVATGELIGGPVYRLPPQPAGALPVVLAAPPVTAAVEPDDRAADDAVVAAAPGPEPAPPPPAAADGRDPAVVAFAPAFPGPAARGAAIAAARAAAARGAAAVLVDLDGGEPALVADADAPGLADLVAGRATFADVLHRGADGGVDVVPFGGRGAVDPVDLVADPRLVLPVAALAKSYDRVVLILPDVAAAVGATFARAVDVLYVPDASRWDEHDAAVAYDALAATGFGDIVAGPGGAGAATDPALAA